MLVNIGMKPTLCTYLETLCLDVENNRIIHAYLISNCTRYDLGKYPSSEEILKGLSLYGYTFNDEVYGNEKTIKRKLRAKELGFYPEVWFQENIVKPFYPEEYMG